MVSPLPPSARSHMCISPCQCQYALRDLMATVLTIKHERNYRDIAESVGSVDLRGPDTASVFMRRLRILGGEGRTRLAYYVGLRLLYWCVYPFHERLVLRRLCLTNYIGLCINEI